MAAIGRAAAVKPGRFLRYFSDSRLHKPETGPTQKVSHDSPITALQLDCHYYRCRLAAATAKLTHRPADPNRKPATERHTLFA